MGSSALPSSMIVSACVLSHLSHVRLFATPWTVAYQAPQPMGFSRQEHQSGLPCPPPGDPPNPEIQLPSLFMSSLAGGFFTTSIMGSCANAILHIF